MFHVPRNAPSLGAITPIDVAAHHAFNGAAGVLHDEKGIERMIGPACIRIGRGAFQPHRHAEGVNRTVHGKALAPGVRENAFGADRAQSGISDRLLGEET
jgi:hypothetical protein